MGIHKGDAFEEMIKYTNNQYLCKNIAVINKISTPMKPVLKNNEIIGAFYEEKSTVDFIGVSNGVAIAFDTKETNETDKFPLSDIKPHQIGFLKTWVSQNGVGFFLVNFIILNKIYRLDYNIAQIYWQQHIDNPRKKGFHSIPLQVFQEQCKEIRSKSGIAIHYLEGINIC